MVNKHICGAKNRNGEPCQDKPMKNGRCYRHGGKSTGVKGNKNAQKHGIYSKFLTNDEKSLLNNIELDHVDDELQLCKIQLIRILKLQSEDIEPENSVMIIDRLIGRIQSLTQLRLDLVSKSLDIELKQLELDKLKAEETENQALPVKVVINVEDARKYPSNDDSNAVSNVNSNIPS